MGFPASFCPKCLTAVRYGHQSFLESHTVVLPGQCGPRLFVAEQAVVALAPDGSSSESDGVASDTYGLVSVITQNRPAADRGIPIVIDCRNWSSPGRQQREASVVPVP